MTTTLSSDNLTAADGGQRRLETQGICMKEAGAIATSEAEDIGR